MSFFAYPGSWIFWKATKFYFEGYGPEIHRKLHKWCCRRILKLFRLFRAKQKFCINFSFFEFFCIPLVMHFFDKSLSSFLRVTCLKFIGNFKGCCGHISKLFRLFRAKNKFCINSSFFEFFCISGVMEFLKNH